MPRPDPVLRRLRKFCLSLPDATETMTWGMPNFRVGEKIFCGYDTEGGKPSIGFKLDEEVALEIISDPRFFRAPNFGGEGWVGLRAHTIRNWDEVRALVRESYRRCTPKEK